jgi:hypothetical protein
MHRAELRVMTGAKVILTVTRGTFEERELVFTAPTTWVVGRGESCDVRIADPSVSRRHCLLVVDPPEIRVRDLGSRRGTSVNGVPVDQRDHRLNDDDLLELAHRAAVFRVSIVAAARDGPKLCPSCGRSIAQAEVLCADCRDTPLAMPALLVRAANEPGAPEELRALHGYQHVELLARGGMGLVSRVQHACTKRQLALKVMLPHQAADADPTRRFLREVDNWSALRHPNVVELVGHGCWRGIFFFVMEYCDGRSVGDLVARARGGTLKRRQALEIAFDVLDGLAYTHAADIPHVELADGTETPGRGVVHRDLHLGNILLTSSGRRATAKICDYGLAKAFQWAGLTDLTRTRTRAGLPYCQPRQQVRSFRYAQPDVDVWATAACLYEMLTGHSPRDFPPGRDPFQVVLETRPVPIRKRDRSIPERLAEVIDEALVDDPEIPFKTATELTHALMHV